MNKRTDEEWQELLNAQTMRAKDMEDRWRDEQRVSENLRSNIKGYTDQLKQLQATLDDKILLVKLLKEKCGIK